MTTTSTAAPATPAAPTTPPALSPAKQIKQATQEARASMRQTVTALQKLAEVVREQFPRGTKGDKRAIRKVSADLLRAADEIKNILAGLVASITPANTKKPAPNTSYDRTRQQQQHGQKILAAYKKSWKEAEQVLKKLFDKKNILTTQEKKQLFDSDVLPEIKNRHPDLLLPTLGFLSAQQATRALAKEWLLKETAPLSDQPLASKQNAARALYQAAYAHKTPDSDLAERLQALLSGLQTNELQSMIEGKHLPKNNQTAKLLLAVAQQHEKLRLPIIKILSGINLSTTVATTIRDIYQAENFVRDPKKIQKDLNAITVMASRARSHTPRRDRPKTQPNTPYAGKSFAQDYHRLLTTPPSAQESAVGGERHTSYVVHATENLFDALTNRANGDKDRRLTWPQIKAWINQPRHEALEAAFLKYFSEQFSKETWSSQIDHVLKQLGMVDEKDRDALRAGRMPEGWQLIIRNPSALMNADGTKVSGGLAKILGGDICLMPAAQWASITEVINDVAKEQRWEHLHRNRPEGEGAPKRCILIPAAFMLPAGNAGYRQLVHHWARARGNDYQDLVIAGLLPDTRSNPPVIESPASIGRFIFDPENPHAAGGINNDHHRAAASNSGDYAPPHSPSSSSNGRSTAGALVTAPLFREIKSEHRPTPEKYAAWLENPWAPEDVQNNLLTFIKNQSDQATLQQAFMAMGMSAAAAQKLSTGEMPEGWQLAFSAPCAQQTYNDKDPNRVLRIQNVMFITEESWAALREHNDQRPVEGGRIKLTVPAGLVCPPDLDQLKVDDCTPRDLQPQQLGTIDLSKLPSDAKLAIKILEKLCGMRVLPPAIVKGLTGIGSLDTTGAVFWNPPDKNRHKFKAPTPPQRSVGGGHIPVDSRHRPTVTPDNTDSAVVEWGAPPPSAPAAAAPAPATNKIDDSDGLLWGASPPETDAPSTRPSSGGTLPPGARLDRGR